MVKNFLKPIKTTTFVILVTGFVFLVSGALIVGFVKYSMRQYALTEAEAKNRIILDRALATHTYFSHIMKPKLFEWSKPFRTAEYFEPSWMSSTYAIRQIDKYFRSLNPVKYYFKDAAISARSPENEADKVEQEFIKLLNSDPKLEFISSIRTIEGEPYFAIMRRGEIMEKSCLRCHSDPSTAPRDLIQQYDDKRSFHREMGETISAISIRIPLSAAYENVEQSSIKISIFIAMSLVILLGILFYTTKLFLINPLNVLRDNALKISTDKKHLGKTIQVATPSKELNSVASAFNSMSRQLGQVMGNLEFKVEERTSSLKTANDLLQQEISVRKQIEEELEEYRDHLETLVQERTAALQKETDEHRQALITLGESEARWRSLTETSPDHILTLDLDLKIRFTNFAAPGLTVKELIGVPLYQFAGDKEKQDEVKSILENVLKTGEQMSYETEYHDPEGGELHYESRVVPRTLEGSNEIIGLTVSARNITDHKQAENQLRQYRENLEKMVSLRTAELEKEIGERKQIEKELHQNMEDLERFSELAVGREEQMIKLKEEINTLLARSGQKEKYTIAT